LAVKKKEDLKVQEKRRREFSAPEAIEESAAAMVGIP